MVLMKQCKCNEFSISEIINSDEKLKVCRDHVLFLILYPVAIVVLACIQYLVLKYLSFSVRPDHRALGGGLKPDTIGDKSGFHFFWFYNKQDYRKFISSQLLAAHLLAYVICLPIAYAFVVYRAIKTKPGAVFLPKYLSGLAQAYTILIISSMFFVLAGPFIEKLFEFCRKRKFKSFLNDTSKLKNRVQQQIDMSLSKPSYLVERRQA